MIPIPALIMNRITFPLQLLAAKLSTALFQLVGIVALREGNINLARFRAAWTLPSLERNPVLLALVTLAIIYGYLMETRKWVRVALALSAVPIAVVANSFRFLSPGCWYSSDTRI